MTCSAKRVPPGGRSSSTKPEKPGEWAKASSPRCSRHGYTGAVDRVASRDSFIPLGDAALTVLLSEDTIEAAAVKLAG